MYPFPPDQGIAHVSAWRIVLQVAVLVIGLGGWSWCLLRRSRRAKTWDILLWPFFGCVLALVMKWTFGNVEYSIPLQMIYSIVIWCVALAGTFATLIKLNIQRKQLEGLAVLFSCISVMLLFLPVCLSGVGDASEAAQRTGCLNNLKELTYVFYDYDKDNETLPLRVAGEPEFSWRVEILPYLALEPLQSRYNFTQPWDSPANAEILDRRPQVYACPSMIESRPGMNTQTAYAVPSGPGTLWREDKPVALTDLLDGSSQTLMLVEACGQGIAWTEPRDVNVSRLQVGFNLPGNTVGQSDGVLSSYHPQVACVAFADGSVRSLANINPEVLKSLLSPNGGEKLKATEF